MQSTEATDYLWRNRPEVVRAFLDVRPNYVRLAEEVAYILEQAVRQAGIEFAQISCRAKSLESFCEKVFRKKYADPLKETTDFGGVRIVFLYLSDRPKLEKLIEKHFKIVEKTDKVDKSDPERFGYDALHYTVQLGERDSGARYDELKKLVCEIQVRTILQDSWAVVGHHLSYKQESDVPKALRRKLNALSGLFETADDQFDRVRDERTAYARKVKKQITQNGQEFLKSDINLENLVVYLRWRFPKREQPIREDAAALLSEIANRGLTSLAQIDQKILASSKAVEAYETEDPPVDIETGADSPYTAAGAVRVVFNFEDDLSGKPDRSGVRESRKKFLHLVDSSKLS